jgi:hypothetical protein
MSKYKHIDALSGAFLLFAGALTQSAACPLVMQKISDKQASTSPHYSPNIPRKPNGFLFHRRRGVCRLTFDDLTS